MNDAQIEATYTALAESIARVGVAKTHLFLATLALDLLSKQPDDGAALAYILRAESVAKL
jgi:hypothetical protein